MHALWAVRDEQLLTADPQDIVRRCGHLLQELVDPAV